MNAFNICKLLTIVGLLLSLSGCSKPEPTVRGVDVSVYDPFPPQDSTNDLHTFKLTEEEVSLFQKHSRLLLSESDSSCNCGVSQFRFTVHYDDGETISGHFFHGPECLTIERQNLIHVECPKEFYDKIVAMIRKRDWMKKTSEPPAEN